MKDRRTGVIVVAAMVAALVNGRVLTEREKKALEY